MRSSLSALAILLTLAVGARTQERVSPDDVHRFVSAFATRSSADSTCSYLDPFIRDASPGQRAYFSKFDVDRKAMCRAIRRDSTAYLRLGSELRALDSLSHDIRAMMVRFTGMLSSDAMPDVYFVVGNEIAGGTTTRGRHPVILIGTERAGSLAGIGSTVAHEFVHTQQHYAWIGSLTGGPAFLAPLKGTLLRASITEGSADFVAELLTGRLHRYPYGEAHAAELWADFRRDMHGKDYSRWLYNGWNRAALGNRPPDLGYFIGYSIAKAYYTKAADKRAALRDILNIRDFDQFLNASGYAGL